MGDMDPRRRDDATNDAPASVGEPLVAPDEDPEFAAALGRVAEVLGEPPDDLTAQRHLSAMRRARRTHGGRGAIRVAGVAVAASFALVATLAGLGSLPAPAQQVMADAAERIGITIPGPQPRGEVREQVQKRIPSFDEAPGNSQVRGEGSPQGFPKPEVPGDDAPGLGSRPDGPPGQRDDGTPPGLDVAPGKDAEREPGRPEDLQEEPDGQAPGRDRGEPPDEPPAGQPPEHDQDTGRDRDPGPPDDPPGGQSPPSGGPPDEPAGQGQPDSEPPDEPPGQGQPGSGPPDHSQATPKPPASGGSGMPGGGQGQSSAPGTSGGGGPGGQGQSGSAGGQGVGQGPNSATEPSGGQPGGGNAQN